MEDENGYIVNLELIRKPCIEKGYSLQKMVNLTAINSVAQQTKLLSFNASLEEACVCSKASVFSIVAGEMQKLANQTK